MTDKPGKEPRRKWQVRLAAWSYGRGHHRVHRVITTWWQVRNWWLHNVWWPVHHWLVLKPWWWVRARIWGCHKHEKPYPYMGVPGLWKYCFRCALDDMHRKIKVDQLKSSKPPPG